MINLRPLKDFKFPILAECINPDVFQGMTLFEIETLEVWEGNKRRKLGELFKVEEVKTDNQTDSMAIQVLGDISKVRRIGLGMKSGEIVVNGDVGMHLGEEMKNGKITVHGNAGGWAGSMMKGGSIVVHGDVGDYLGAPYRGCTQGIRGGTIVVHGNAGTEAGAYMKKGTIKVHGNAGQFLGLRMAEGTIYAKGNCEARAGACMVGGKIVIDGHLESVLPSFTIDTIRPKVKIDETETAQGPFYVFLGDLTENGNGKLYVSKIKNSHLSHREKFL